ARAGEGRDGALGLRLRAAGRLAAGGEGLLMVRAGVELHVDRLVVDTELGSSEAERLAPVLRAAFQDLARRLERAPAGRWRNTTRLALARLCIDAVPVDELLGPRGAARLADAFWAELLATQGTR